MASRACDKRFVPVQVQVSSCQHSQQPEAATPRHSVVNVDPAQSAARSGHPAGQHSSRTDAAGAPQLLTQSSCEQAASSEQPGTPAKAAEARRRSCTEPQPAHSRSGPQQDSTTEQHLQQQQQLTHSCEQPCHSHSLQAEQLSSGSSTLLQQQQASQPCAQSHVHVLNCEGFFPGQPGTAATGLAQAETSWEPAGSLPAEAQVRCQVKGPDGVASIWHPVQSVWSAGHEWPVPAADTVCMSAVAAACWGIRAAGLQQGTPAQHLAACPAGGSDCAVIHPSAVPDRGWTTSWCTSSAYCWSAQESRSAPSEDGTVGVALLATCQAALRGRFPLGGTYFQTNERFLLHLHGRMAAIQVSLPELRQQHPALQLPRLCSCCHAVCCRPHLISCC